MRIVVATSGIEISHAKASILPFLFLFFSPNPSTPPKPLLIHPPSKTACRQVYQGIRFSGFRGSLIFGLLQGGAGTNPALFLGRRRRGPHLWKEQLFLFLVSPARGLFTGYGAINGPWDLGL